MTTPRRLAGEVSRAATRARARRALRRVPGVPGSLVGIYRHRNARLVCALVDSALAEGWRTAWWALDETDDGLAPHTVGHGAGAKFTLLNEIVARAGLEDGWLVVADDDLVFRRGSAGELVSLCDAAGLALAQPAHVATSAVSHEITLSRALSIARRTNFVEIGPVFVVAPSWRAEIVPFPETAGMGWRLGLEWADLAERGCRLGIVDVVTVSHLGAVGGDYDIAHEQKLLKAELGARGIDRWRDTHRTLETWRPWQRRPPWAARAVP
jgi:hypothetical protein